MQLFDRQRKHQVSVEIQRSGHERFAVTVDGQPYPVEATLLDASTLNVSVDQNRQTIRIARLGGALHVAVDGEVYVFVAETGTAQPADSVSAASPLVRAPMPGKVLQVLVHEGQAVKPGDALLVLEAMKMETRLVAETAGVVRRILVDDGQMVAGGAVMVELEYSE